MKKNLVIIGKGNHSKVVLEMIKEKRLKINPTHRWKEFCQI